MFNNTVRDFLMAVPLRVGRAATEAVVAHRRKSVPCHLHSGQMFSLPVKMDYHSFYYNITRKKYVEVVILKSDHQPTDTNILIYNISWAPHCIY
jgi:predicted class III extradiol MEMO1 family dioxygenase